MIFLAGIIFFLNVKINLCDLCCLSWLFAAGRGTSRHLLSPLWRLVLRWWCGTRAAAVAGAVEEMMVVPAALPVASSSILASRMRERPSEAGQAAQLAMAGAAMAARRAEV